MKMIYLIYLVWFLNLFMNMVILLNFLIAIISQSYDRVISNKLVNLYNHKSDLNIERLLFQHYFTQKKLSLMEFDLTCIVSCHDQDLSRYDEICGLTFNLK